MANLIERFSLFVGSIRFRLTVWFVVILGLVVVAFSGFIYVRQVQILRAVAVARLELKVRRLRGFFRLSPQDYFQTAPLPIPRDPTSGEAFLQEGDTLALIDPNGNVIGVFGSLNTDDIRRIANEALENENFDRPFPGIFLSAITSAQRLREPYLFLFAPVQFDGQGNGYLLIGNPVDPGNQLPRLLVTLGMGIVLTLGVALLGGLWLAGRAMQPVKAITETAQKISDTDLSLRLRLKRKDELGILADTFDEMLGRLQSAFERQRQFTADASHELRTPLTIVDLETSRALAAQRSPEEYERVLKVVHSENQFMIRMVNNLLTLARMDAGQVTLHKENLDLSDVTLEVVERLAPLATQENVRLIVGELPELTVYGDRQYLTQMLTNLVDNAIKYSSGEDKRVWVEAGQREEEAQRWAWVRVRDNGRGIPTEALPHLFDRFYQVDQARTRREGAEDEGEQVPSGSGLGLSIALWIARAHQGDIQVQSELGKGSVFEVSLPISASPSDAAADNEGGEM